MKNRYILSPMELEILECMVAGIRHSLSTRHLQRWVCIGRKKDGELEHCLESLCVNGYIRLRVYPEESVWEVTDKGKKSLGKHASSRARA